MVFSAFDIESILISEIRAGAPAALPWNDSGFGSNDPGRRRDGQESARFDRLYPVDIDRPLGIARTGGTVGDVLRDAKSAVPYLLRYEGHPELGTPITVSEAKTLTMRDILRLSVDALPSGWQATVLHGRVILYRERREYDFMIEQIRKRG